MTCSPVPAMPNASPTIKNSDLFGQTAGRARVCFIEAHKTFAGAQLAVKVLGGSHRRSAAVETSIAPSRNRETAQRTRYPENSRCFRGGLPRPHGINGQNFRPTKSLFIQEQSIGDSSDREHEFYPSHGGRVSDPSRGMQKPTHRIILWQTALVIPAFYRNRHRCPSGAEARHLSTQDPNRWTGPRSSNQAHQFRSNSNIQPRQKHFARNHIGSKSHTQLRRLHLKFQNRRPLQSIRR
jgi:hypothetical protein